MGERGVVRASLRRVVVSCYARGRGHGRTWIVSACLGFGSNVIVISPFPILSLLSFSCSSSSLYIHTYVHTRTRTCTCRIAPSHMFHSPIVS